MFTRTGYRIAPWLLTALACAGLTPCMAQSFNSGELDKLLRAPIAVDGTDQTAPTANAAGSVPEAPAFAPPFTHAPLTQNPPKNFDSLKTLTNFHAVTPFLLRGGQPTASDLALLKSAGVRTVIDLRNEDVLVREEASQARAAGLQFVSIPLDVFNQPSEQAVRQFMRIVDDSAQQPVYVHCLHGQDRTGTMVAIYRIERQGWSADQAYAEMISDGFRPGFGRLAQAVFAHGARSGRPGTPPNAGDILTDLQSRFSRARKK